MKKDVGKIDESELLTKLLQPYLPPEACAVVAKNLLVRFGSAYRVLLASESTLARVEGMTQAAAFYLPMQYKTYLRIRSEQKVLTGDSLYQFAQIAVNLAGGRSTEALYLALLDKSNRLCGCHFITEGATNNVNVDMRKIYRTVTEFPDVESIIFIHNHPSGCIIPSGADVDETKRIESQLFALGIKIKDHIVVGNGEAFSFSAGGIRKSPAHQNGEMVLDADGMPFFPENFH